MEIGPPILDDLPGDRLLTWEDLNALPDHPPWRYELVEGLLIVTPNAPSLRHQSCVGSVYLLLRQAKSPDLQVIVAPFDFTPRTGDSLQPDVMLARRPVGASRLEEAPVLVVEVLSPGTRLVDRTLKRAAYDENGVEHYWIVDPAGPSITAMTLIDGAYQVVAEAGAGETFAVTSPLHLTFGPQTLLDD